MDGWKNLLADPRLRKWLLFGAGGVYLAWNVRQRLLQRRRAEHRQGSMDGTSSGESRGLPDTAKASGSGKKDKVKVNAEFFRRLSRLIKIIIPGIRTKEFSILTLHTFFLVSRTIVSIYVAKLDGSIVKTIVDKHPRAFGVEMLKWLLVAVPATYINSMIRYLESKLALSFRTRLVDRVYSMYMRDEVYYRVTNIDRRLANPDQCLTEDVAQFCNELAHLYSQVSKPMLDVVLMTAQLVMLSQERTGGDRRAQSFPFLIATSVVGLTALILRFFTPPFGKMIAEEARLYGHLRAVHSRVIAHAEEIAFYGGDRVEEGVLRRAYDSLKNHLNLIYRKRIPFTMLEQWLMKYIWGAAGLVMIALPTFLEKPQTGGAAVHPPQAVVPSSSPPVAPLGLTESLLDGKSGSAEDVSVRTQNFITARALLLSGADAIERIMSSWKDLTELAGRTSRVYEMFQVFEEVREGKYAEPGVVSAARKPLDEKMMRDATPEELAFAEQQRQKILKYAGKTGKVVESEDLIVCEDVPIVTPSGDVLVSDPGLNLVVDHKKNQHLLISGPNGCGKSSLFRTLGGLWPTRGGRMHRPAKGSMFYIPQRPYLSEGSLREQFIYPDTKEDMLAKGWTDEKLLEMLEIVNLVYVVKRYPRGLDAVQDWTAVLSGGEKQRSGMARLFYHRPKFAILDECTSQVSVDVEGQMYTHAKKIGITLLTVTHRTTLRKYHTHLLQFDGAGNYSFCQMDSLAEEKLKLERQLAEVAEVQERLRIVCRDLGVESKYLTNGAVPSDRRSDSRGTSSAQKD